MDNLSMKKTKTKEIRNKRFSTMTIAKIGILAAVAALLMLFEIPLFFAPGFYKLDFSEVAVLLGAFSMGPIAGVAIEAVKIIINFAVDGSVTAGVGEVANFLIGCSFVVPAAIIYKRNKSRKSAIIGLAVGVALMVVFSAFINLYVLLPVFAVAYGMPIDAIIKMGNEVNPAITNINTLVMFATVPFNMLKGLVTSLITILIYKKLSVLLHR